MSDTKPLRLFSYTRAASDHECNRKRYLSREWGGTGLQLIREAWPLIHGNLVHKALEDFAKQGAVDFMALRVKTRQAALDSGMDQIAARDWAALVEGQVRGFIRTVWPSLLNEYKFVEAEKWIELEFPGGYKFRARQDLLLQSKFDGHYCMVDYKNTSSTKPQWIASWSRSVQMHSSMYALNNSTDIKIERCLVIGLSKGYKDEKLKTQRSPFNYGWINREYGMVPQYSYEYQRSKGWELFSTAEEFDDLEEWIAKMPQSILSEQFPQTAPIFYREDIASEWFKQQLLREAEVGNAAEMLSKATTVAEITDVLRKAYRQNFSHCKPAFGYGCEFEELCWIPHVQADPLASGLFKRYISELEIE